jgi:type IV pilus assembly protein PilX
MVHARIPVDRPIACRSDGSALVMALVMLTLLSVVALATSRGALLQQRLAGGLRNAQLAQWAAESALRAAEWRLWKAGADDATRILCGNGDHEECYLVDPQLPHSVVTRFRQRGWVEEGGTESTSIDHTLPSEDGSFRLAKNPYYLIEDLGRERTAGAGPQSESGASAQDGIEPHLYRITARATGSNKQVVRMVESTFSAKSD